MATSEDGTETRTQLRTGQQYVESLRDNRVVFYKGERVEDVTTHEATAGGIRQIADIYDLQFDPEAQNVLTYVRDDGTRVTSSYLIPRTKDDLRFRREGIKYVARQSFGTVGRGIDMIATLPLGMLAELPSFQRECPEYAENIHWLLRHYEDNNIRLGETIVDPQGYRSRASGTKPDTQAPERATARIVDENKDGIFISGVKGVGTAVPQSNEMIIGSFHPPLDEESFWVYVPVDAPGLRMFQREVVRRPGSDAYDHPLTSRGEEIESIVAFDACSCRASASWRATSAPCTA